MGRLEKYENGIEKNLLMVKSDHELWPNGMDISNEVSITI